MSVMESAGTTDIAEVGPEEVAGTSVQAVSAAPEEGVPTPILHKRAAHRIPCRVSGCMSGPFKDKVAENGHYIGFHVAPEKRREAAMAQEESAKETQSLLKGILERLDRLQTTAVPIGKLTEVVQAAVQPGPGSTDLPPELKPLVDKAGDLGKLCEIAPELCTLIEERRATKASTPLKPPEEPPAVAAAGRLTPAEVHNALLNALREAGQRVLGREPTWNDLLANCPNGDCGLHIAPLLAKHPDLLELVLREEGAAEQLLGILQKMGKLKREPEVPAPAKPAEQPGEEAVHAGAGAEGIFAGILRE